MHKAKELIFFGDDLSAADAAEIGIVNKVVPAGELQSTTKDWAERLAAGPTKAIGWAKKLLHDSSELSRRDLLEEEAMLVELNSSTVDSGEGVASFRERRAPEWKGW
jgi:2-(1,2-epoxy-1,2-dihydrophenyl)acetyl-CoA isomerase